MLETAVGVVTIIAVGIAAYGLFYNVKATKQQANTQLFLDYTARYERIMESFPAEALSARLDLDGELPPESPELSRSILRYLNMSSEELYLHERGYLDSDIWTIWERELNRTLQSPLLRREWASLRPEFESYPKFRDYVDRIQRPTNLRAA